MDYNQTIDYLFSRLPMFSRIGAAAYKKDLTNIKILCEALGNPQEKYKIIHVAGTNGKGSVCHSLAAILQTSGYKTGLHTSPHLNDFRERIKVNGHVCSEDFVIAFTKKINPLVEQIEPSFFEISVAMAFQYFAEENVDVAVIETGLGGRLDSTNIVSPILSVITNIGLDHTNMLGNTLAEIAFEKAGIIKPDIPVVIGEIHPETKPLFEKAAAERNTKISFAQHHFYTDECKYADNKLLVKVMDIKNDTVEKYMLDLPGIYQVKNLITVLDAINHLQKQGFNISRKNVYEALLHVKKLTGLHGRWEKIKENPAVIIDVAHNEDGMKQLIDQLELCIYKTLHVITGMVKDKDIDKVLSLMPKNATYYFTQANIPRALPAQELAAKALTKGLCGEIFSDVNTALQYALTKAATDDMILICGSVFLAGEVKY